MEYFLIAVYAFLILLGIGIILGVLLVLFSKIWEVKEDERIKEVEKMLPNFNCGACGKAGCHDMAVAIVKGEVSKLSQCKPGKKDKNYDPIIEYMSSHPDEDGTKHVPTI
ncbi:MAG: electron transporter RnfB [Bacilli bacterium]|nr:electron transporter RnfB [Bacilli bacterium]